MIRTVIFWFVCSLIVAVLGPVFIVLTFIDRKKRIPAWIATFWCWCLVKIAGVRIKIKGEEVLHRYTQYVLVSNHQSYFDIFTLIVVLKKIPHFLAKKELFRIPIFGQALRVADVIEIDRENPDKALESIKKALSKGLDYPICIYPEGTRSPDGRLQPFRKKGLFLLMDVGLPFVPIAFYGTRNVMPKGSLRVKPAQVCIVVGEPLHIDKGLPEEEKDRMRHLLWEKVHACLKEAEGLCRSSS